MKLFAQLQSCCRPCPAKLPKAPPSNGGSHHRPLRSAASRPFRRCRSHWRPGLSDIMEDRTEDHRNNIDNSVVSTPHKKPSVTLSSHDDDHHRIRERRKSMPIIMFPPFSMF